MSLHRAISYKQITGLDSVKTLAASVAIPTDARYAAVQAEGQNVRYREDNENPTASAGMLLLTTQPPLMLSVKDLSKVKFIEASATAKLNVTFYK